MPTKASKADFDLSSGQLTKQIIISKNHAKFCVGCILGIALLTKEQSCSFVITASYVSNFSLTALINGVSRRDNVI